MAIIEDILFEEYPYEGVFYTVETDYDAPLDEREPKEVLVQEVCCDIQRQGARHSGSFLGAGYTVYFPLEENPNWDGIRIADKYLPIKVKRGMMFRGGDSIYPIVGEIEFVRFSQLGQASVDIQVKTENEQDEY